MSAVPARVAAVTVIAVLALIILAEVLIYAPPRPASEATEVSLASSALTGSRLSVVLAVRPGADTLTLSTIAVPLQAPSLDRTVLVFDDPAYALVGIDRSAVSGIYYLLSVQLSSDGYTSATRLIDAKDLATSLHDISSARRTAIVVTTGALPVQVLSRTADLITPWVRAGGMLIWGGPAFGEFSVAPNVPVDPFDQQTNLGPAAPDAILGRGVADIAKPDPSQAFVGSPVAAWLGLEFQRTDAATLTAGVSNAHGLVLGWKNADHCSICSVPIGHGMVVLFGGLVDGEAVFAHDVGHLLLSHVVDSNGAVAGTAIPLDGVGGIGSLTWQTAVDAATPIVEVSVLDPNPEGTLYIRRDIHRT